MGEPNDKALEQDSASPDGTNTSPLSTQSQQPEDGWLNNEDDEESPEAQETGGSNKIPHATAFESEDSDQGSEDFSETMQRPDSTGKASKASARRNNNDICRAPIASSPIRLAYLQKSLGRKATTASQVKHLPASQVMSRLMLQRSSLKTLTKALKISPIARPCSDLTRPHPGDASAHATAFEPEDSDQGSEDFYGTMQRPDSIGKASKAIARRNNTDISRAPSASSPIRLQPLQKSLGRKPTPASQVRHLPASQHPGDASAHAPCSPSSPITRSQSRTNTTAKQDLPQMLSDESYSTIALVILGCNTKADIGNKIGKYVTDFKILSYRKAFNNKPFDEKIRMVVEDSIRRNLVSLQGRAARQEGKLILERANVKFNAHLAF
ncbi:hypothetical protein R1sor_000824 [Riccia sorocarpa]|uniref:Uncharacterized protein n=1 Tax=Riccia sorocarpa TaxID=122646 RepID=A0ABD3GU72_9MARC